MTRVHWIWLTVCLAGAGAFLESCGTSNDNPPLYAELRFQVQAAAGSSAAFSVDRIVAGGRAFVFPADTVFTGVAPFTFFVENSSLPVYGNFTRIGDAEITVQLFRQPTESAVATDSTSGDKDSAVVSFGGAVDPNAPQDIPMLRVDVCAPANNVPCSVFSTEPGGSGVRQPYNGSIGDLSVSYLVNGFAPAVYFFRDASGTASAVVASNAGVQLTGRMFVDNELKETDSSTHDVVLRTDL